MAESTSLPDRIKLLYTEHDHLESVLILRAARGMEQGGADLWRIHDDLEREIIAAEASLPYETCVALRAGDPGVEH